MKITAAGRLYTGFIVAFILALVVGVFTYLTFQNQAKEAKWVSHTYQVANDLDEIYGIIADMSTGRRGFRATNDKKFLEPYYIGSSRIGPAVQDLKKLIDDNPTQAKNVLQLEDDVNVITTFWRSLGTDASKYTQEDVIAITTKEKVLMDIIRADLRKMKQIESELLAIRNKANDDSLAMATTICIGGSVLIMIIILVLIYFILSEFNNRKKAEEALKENLNEVKQLNEESNSQNWLLSGVASVNDSLQGHDEILSLTKNALTSLTTFLGAPASAIYTYNDETTLLELRASLGLPGNVAQTYHLGEGIVGKAATERKAVVTTNVPAGYWSINSATGTALPGEILCLPLWYNRELKGVLEIVTFGKFKQLDIDLLNGLSNNIAVSINAADAREKVMLLLEQVQLQRLDLQNQQEELRQTNEELTRQAEALQASEEELRVQEEELRQINAELEEKNEAVEISRQALSFKARELEVTGKYKSEFLANMSHELRTPLNSVLILAKILSENKQANLSNKQIEYANIIHKSGTDLLNLINDILDLSKIEAGKIDFNFEDVKVDGMMQDLNQTFFVLAEEKSINFVQKKDKSVPDTLHTDKQRLEQIIKNLLSNAFKFTPKDGTITLSINTTAHTNNLNEEHLRKADKLIMISVTDTGIGIAKEKQQLIFEAFQQADGSTSRKFGGTGLGLSISKELIKKLGGEIRLESEEGKGSTFSIYLPADKIEHAAQEVEQAPVQELNINIADLTENVTEQTMLADDRENIQKGDRVMLIVEDDPQFASILQDFAQSKSYKTVVALQGDEGVYYAKKYKPSAIILDMQLPVIDGWTILKILKNDAVLSKIPVHVISAMDDISRVENSALAYLKKPVAKDDLEKAFTLIGSVIKSSFKKVLVLSGDYLKNDVLKKIINDRNSEIVCDYVKTEAEAIEKLKNNDYDCVVADIGKDLEAGTKQVQHIQEVVENKKTPVIVYLDKALTAKDEMELKKISDVVIQDSRQSKDRLMDELELFLYKVQQEDSVVVPNSARQLNDEKVLNGKKVLLVDDDMRNVFALTTLLEEHDMDVITAGDGKEALSQLDEHNDIDIVLMDIMMPEMDGYEATRRIRANTKFSHLPVIALTAKAMQGDREKTIEAGASDYITKPVDTARLFSLMRVWLSQ